MVSDILSGILSEYDGKCSVYTDFTSNIKDLVTTLLDDAHIHVLNVEFRTKSKGSLQNKLSRPEERYSTLSDITDIAGIRIITFFSDDVDTVSEIIRREFDIDWDNSVDKRTLLDPDRFGYLSLHYVASLSAARLELTEYHRFLGCKVEIQIRSILQHTWAEIEHDLGYKSKKAIPDNIIRNFSQLAGLLEIADQQFIEIRNRLSEYENAVSSKINQDASLVSIDKASLIAWYKNSVLLQSADNKIASGSSTEIVFNADYLGNRVDQLYYAGFNTISDLENFLKAFESVIVSTANQVLGPKRKDNLSSGITLYYLGHVKILHDGSGKSLFGWEVVSKFVATKADKDFDTRLKVAYEKASANKK